MVKILIFLFLMTEVAMADKPYTFNTGFAYEVCNGVNIGALKLAPGTVRMEPTGCSLVETPDELTLDLMVFPIPIKTVKEKQADLNNQALQNVIASEISADPVLNAQQTVLNNQTVQVNGTPG